MDKEAYGNQAACYNKLGAIADGLEDVEKCIELDPKFSGGYIRKAEVEFYLKDCVQEINKANRGVLTPEDLKERLVRL
uniref:Uncharacterized protein n=1 Tax=Brassica oleracea var. oleracea TaxID=109376 RepID=A0A0D3C0K4_BRAOL